MFWGHYKALLFKNWILWKRRKLEMIIEIFLPLFVFAVISYIRSSIGIIEVDDESYVNNARYIHPSFIGQGSYNFSKSVVFSYCEDYVDSGGDWIIALSPENDVTEFIAEKISSFKMLDTVDVVFFDDNEAIEDYVTDEDYEDNPKICFAVVFAKAEENEYEYSIRFNQTYSIPDESSLGAEVDIFNLDKFDATDDMISTPKSEFQWEFFGSGFIQIQNWVDNFILQQISGNEEAVISAGFVPMHFDDWLDDQFLENVSFLLGFFLVCSMVLPMCRMISQIVREKEEKIKESMSMMGLSNKAFWCSWLTYYLVFYFCISVIISLSFSHIIFNYSSFFLILLLIYLFSLSCISFGCLISIIFSKSRTAVIVGLLFFVAGYFTYFTVDDENISETTKTLASLIPSVGLSLTMRNLVEFEQAYRGLDYEHLTEKYFNYRFSTSYWMIAVDTMIFTLLCFYLDECWPGEWGVKRPWYFLFTKSFWTDEPVEKPEFDELFEKGQNEEDFDVIDDSKDIKIRKVTKKFGDFAAVKDLNLDIHHGKITAILGHNGAGKTTLISMLTGSAPITSGDIKVRDKFLTENSAEIRKILGVCPQHNILYPELTVYEHLQLYAKIKGVSKNKLKKEISEMLIKLALNTHANELSDTLSGGEKRKLCIGLALIGNSQIVILDEPTSGLDIGFRRQLWDVLKNFKGNRIVIITTHYMEEADILADRIVIMKEGSLVCSGSSMYLKSKYGVGYYVTFFKENTAEDESIEKFVKSLWPTASLLNTAHAEISFRLPQTESSTFATAFDRIDAEKELFGIKSYVISLSTLEEVFIKASENQNADVEEYEEDEYFLPEESEEKPFFKDFWLLLKKRFIISKRDLMVILLEFLIPLAIMILGTWQMMIMDIIISQDPYKEVISQYETPQDILYAVQNSVVEDVMANLNNQEAITISDTTTPTLKAFDEVVFDERYIDPYRMGALFFFQMENDTYEPVIFHNQTAFQSMSTYYQETSLSILHLYNPDLKITVYNHPLPITNLMKEADSYGDAMITALIFGLAFSFIPAGIVCLGVKENLEGIKFQHTISGCSLAWYWITNFFWEYVKYLLFMIGVIIIMFAFDVEIFISPSENLIALIVTLLLYGLAVIPFTYCTIYLFSSTSSAQVITLMFNFVMGSLLPVLMFILWSLDETRDFSRKSRWVFRVFPNFAVGNSLIYLGLGDIIAYLNGETEADPVLSLDRVGGDIMLLSISAFSFTVLFIIIEYLKTSPKFNKFIDITKPPQENDNQTEDVIAENDKANAVAPEEAAVLVKDVSNVYWNFYDENYAAVKHMNVVIPPGECFVLLGNNGAGKTTIFKIIAGQISPTAGNIYIKGIDVDDNGALKNIGYCQQFEALNEFLTLKETLFMYASFKSMRSPKKAVKLIMKKFDFKKFKDVQVGNLSGGNRRKLSVACAVLGNPSVMVLDEPSCSMDPLSRKHLWGILSQLKQNDTSVLITTHSMDEAEALSDRIGIMVKGAIKYIGTTNSLRSTLGDDLEIIIKLKRTKKEKIAIISRQLDTILGQAVSVNRRDINDCLNYLGLNQEEYLENECVIRSLNQLCDEDGSVFRESLVAWVLQEKKGQKVLDWIRSELGTGEIIDHYFNIYHFKVKRDSQSMGALFRQVEDNYRALKITEYSINLTSLVNVFNKLNEDN
ncbi:hypothetical protein SteCoe_22546 [Stentor coeruleus]|uniref:ABC transporter domain-containing protein n=1 Tax=Stentor coeruleus TaxID=5963 RepID=A0A1R2BM09_9CILI|nr:hypothetical protein SteCoe_22546 [Stentor coeruleus]